MFGCVWIVIINGYLSALKAVMGVFFWMMLQQHYTVSEVSVVRALIEWLFLPLLYNVWCLYGKHFVCRISIARFSSFSPLIFLLINSNLPFKKQQQQQQQLKWLTRHSQNTTSNKEQRSHLCVLIQRWRGCGMARWSLWWRPLMGRMAPSDKFNLYL